MACGRDRIPAWMVRKAKIPQAEDSDESKDPPTLLCKKDIVTIPNDGDISEFTIELSYITLRGDFMRELEASADPNSPSCKELIRLPFLEEAPPPRREAADTSGGDSQFSAIIKKNSKHLLR